MFTPRTPRVVAARRLHRRAERDQQGRFLAEGPQAVREALAAGVVEELFVTGATWDRHAELVDRAGRVSLVTDEALAVLAETLAPQGVVAVCRQPAPSLSGVLDASPRLVVLLAGIADPGNAGTVLRTADAAGADAVLFTRESVDPFNGKCVRASAGSLFHLPVVRGVAADQAVAELAAAGLRVLAADPRGECELDGYADSGALAGPLAWLFGGEAHGLPAALAAAAHARVRVPIHGRAESLNLAAAAAVCLYASARAQRSGFSLPAPLENTQRVDQS